jgi:hypothetical protein
VRVVVAVLDESALGCRGFRRKCALLSRIWTKVRVVVTVLDESSP